MASPKTSAARTTLRVVVVLLPVLVLHAFALFQWYALKDASLANEKWYSFYEWADADDWFGYHFVALLMIIVAKSIVVYFGGAWVFIKTGKFPRTQPTAAAKPAPENNS